MSRRSANVDFSIRSDELEHNRIQLENNLQNTDLSLRLSSTADDSDVEYPRHNSVPSPPFSAYASFEARSEDHFQPTEQSQMYNAWSYRTLDDDEVNPYGASMTSTAAHHASALTLSAGLGGRRSRRDVSISGAEYDPDRPLQGIIAGMNGLSELDIDTTRSKQMISTAADFDPLVVDDTEEIDRILQSGHAAASLIRSPGSSSSLSSRSEPASIRSESPRPKLSDALHKVAFSPKRPRSAQSLYLPLPPKIPPISPRTRAPSARVVREPQDATPRPKHMRQNQSLSYVNQADLRDGNSRIERDALSGHQNQANPAFGRLPKRQPKTATPLKSKIHLPDVTGLTSAVGTPLRADLEYLGYNGREAGETEVRLLSTLNLVQAKLAFLESENSVSRRRVHELELELEACKQEVAKERTKVLEAEDVAAKTHRARFAQVNTSSGDTSRYREVVEEKKALEALITTLRAHLTRLTSELTDHQRLLTELRMLRDVDARALSEKGKDVDQLRQEVERLAGEVEVLKGVVEEGLKERRLAREQSSSLDEDESADITTAAVLNAPPAALPIPVDDTLSIGRSAGSDDDDDEEESSYLSRQHSPTPSPRRHGADRTVHTDQATLGTSNLVSPSNPRQFVDSVELERISAEVEERRSERSASMLSAQSTRSRPHSQLSTRSGSPALSAGKSRVVSRGSQLASDDSSEEERAEAVRTRARERVARAVSPIDLMEGPSRPSAPTPRMAGQVQADADDIRPARNKPNKSPRPTTETPFPQIRGAHLERLFFSAPEHNAETCNVCHRRRRRHRNAAPSPSWLGQRERRDRRVRVQDEDDDEGFVDEEDEARISDKGKGRDHGARFSRDTDKAPPQTVVTRVLRELEDDFTHYKAIYIELADQYKDMDPVSNVVKRNVLAEHLREVIDILEQKGDQIASLYDVLSYKDRPVGESVVADKYPATSRPSTFSGRSNIRRHATLS